MTRFILTLGLIALATFPSAKAQTKTQLGDFDVSDGKIEKAASDRLMVASKEMRATLKKISPSQKVTLKFTYLGPSSEVSHLGSGEVRHQFGIKLKAQDTCNLVYVMWNFDTQKIAVSVKLNPGQRTHQECLDHGYINNIKPRIAAPPPALHVDEPHTLYAELEGTELTVKADDKIVWQGTLVPVVLQFKGPVGIRSDNAHVVFDFLAG
ncbi:MAG TPA: hypothetical protein VN025_00105 [Candidatus Dormibacteraeota bacterium]|jgi:hypothetical protein|nr:hypothetical protein [Candidatus Dormibacteraeota bacterium]